MIVTLKEARLLSLTIMMAVCCSLGLDIHLASLPHIMAYMHTDKQHMQQSVTLYILGAAISLLFFGPCSDRVGRKPVIIIGLSIACISSFLAAMTHSTSPHFYGLEYFKALAVVLAGA